jgi:hypothetical protein
MIQGRGFFIMKKLILIAALSIITATPFNLASAQDDLIYVAVEPCRIVNTRKGLAQPVRKNNHTNFLVSGSAGELFDQGGQQAGGCAAPKPGQKPAAISAYVVAVPNPSSVSGGVLTVYPSDQPQPPVGAAATVNFEKGQTIGNSTNITLCTSSDCPADGQFAVLARDTDEDVIIDVLGYYYPAANGGATASCSSADVAGSWQSFTASSNPYYWSTCTLQVNTAGKITGGSCSSDNGITDVTGGNLDLNRDCAISGSLYVDGDRNIIQAARLAADRNTIYGVFTNPETAASVTFVRY